MQFIYKMLMLITLITSIILAVIIAVNLDSVRVIGGHVERFVERLLLMTLYCLGGFGVIAALGAITWIVLLIARRRNEDMRQRDGSFPLQRVRVAGGYIYVDPNKIIAPAIAVNGRGVVEIFTADAETHLRHAIERSKVAQMQALAPGDAAIDGRNGFMYRPGAVFNNATGKYLAGAYDRQPLIASAADQPDDDSREEAPAVVAPRLALRRVLEQATPHAWFVGQSDTGELAIFNPAASIHAGIVGSTGSGKTTSAGFVLAAQALRTGCHVVILDPKNGADWSAWRNHAEWHASDPELFERQVAALWHEHERRQRMMLERNASDIAEIGERQALVIIEEYGDLIAQLRRTDRKRADATDATLDRLMRLSRRTGIHLLMIDQYPEEWSNQVLAGCRYLIVFRLGPNQGAKVGEYRADRLPDYGRFSVRGREYNAWFAAPHLDRMLAMTPPSAAPHIIDGEFTVRSQPETGESTSGEQAMNAVMNSTMNAAMNAPAPASLDDWYAWTLAEYLPTHPELLQVDAQGRGVGVSALARAMAQHARGDQREYEAFKGVASGVARRLRESVRLSNGERFGMDVARNGN